MPDEGAIAASKHILGGNDTVGTWNTRGGIDLLSDAVSLDTMTKSG